MKNLFAVATVILTLCSSIELIAQPLKSDSGQKKATKMLVTYFSIPEKNGVDASSGASRVIDDGKIVGNTEFIAKVIAQTTGADLFEITTSNKYSTNGHNELVDYAKNEADKKIFPKISSKISNFAEYDIIFVGYPNWWFDMPMVIYTLFNDYDFSGKTIVPFCTHGGSGFSNSVKTIENLEKNAKVTAIPAISNRNIIKSRDGLITWLKDKGFTNK